MMDEKKKVINNYSDSSAIGKIQILKVSTFTYKNKNVLDKIHFFH